MVRSSSQVSLTEAKRGYEKAVKALKTVYQREVLTTLSGVLDSVALSGDVARLEQYKGLVDSLSANQNNPQFLGQLERLISGDLKESQEPLQVQSEKPKKKDFKRRYFTVDEAIDSMAAADSEKWGRTRTRAAYYQKLKYLDEVKKATTIYSGNKLSRICIADLNGLIPELTRYSPRN